jgi:DDB1- and CUL4-associated factor 4
MNVQLLASLRTTIITPSPAQVHDVWTATLEGKRLVLGKFYSRSYPFPHAHLPSEGMGKRAVWLDDVDAARAFGTLDTGSDVFALSQKENVIITGSRNGAIDRFDLRTHQGHRQGYSMFSRAEHKDARRSAVTELRSVREWELVVSTMNGDVGHYLPSLEEVY